MCRRIGILTSGGDAPGMNAAIRAVTCAALSQGVEVMGIYEGYAGLLGQEMKLFSYHDVADIEGKGGTVLYSARCDAFRTAQGIDEGVQNCRTNGLDALVAIGGDGTLRGAHALCQAGIACIGIPASIDNDIVSTQVSIGFDSAVNTAVRMMDCLKDTSESHARCNVAEVMGRSCGQIALYSGIGAGAVGIAMTEFFFDQDALLLRIAQSRKQGKRDFLVVVAEGKKEDCPTYTTDLAEHIGSHTGVETRTTVLGHVVRGGAPSAKDRLLGSRLGAYAVSLLLEGKRDLTVGVFGEELCAISMETAQAWDILYRDALQKENGTQSQQLPPQLALRHQMMQRDYALCGVLGLG